MDPPQRTKIKATFKKFMPVSWSATSSQTCYYALTAPHGKYAIFDLDDTLFVRDTNTEVNGMIEVARSFRDKGFHLVVMSNQYGITKGKTTHDEVRRRLQELQRTLGGEVSFIYSTAKDKYRKPMTGMYDLLPEHHPDSFYCGDAAGQKGEFAVSDYYFALNCKLKFLTVPDLKPQPTVVSKFQLYKDLDLQSMICKPPPLVTLEDKPILVIMVGPQGAGKSTLSALLKDRGFHVLNRDTIKSSAKLFTEFKKLCASRQSIVIDNMNYSKDERQKYLHGLDESYRAVCYYFDISKIFSVHLCHMRVQLGGAYIPPVARHTYYKRLEMPTEKEHLEIIVVKGFPDWGSMTSEYFYQYNLIDH